MIMYDSPQAAHYRTDIKGWVSSEGMYYGENEHLARWAGSTHQKCECGNVYERGRTRCNSCDSKLRHEKYTTFPMVEWDGSTPVCTFDDDKFFFDECSLLDWMGELKWEAEQSGEGLPIVELVLCEPHSLGYVDVDHWADDLPEDGELPSEVQEKLDELNAAIKRAPVASWWAGTTRINIDALWAQVEKDETPVAK